MASARMVALLARALDRLTDLSAGERGATATEYAILVGFIAIAIVAGVTLVGANLNEWFSSLASQLP